MRLLIYEFYKYKHYLKEYIIMYICTKQEASQLREWLRIKIILVHVCIWSCIVYDLCNALGRTVSPSISGESGLFRKGEKF